MALWEYHETQRPDLAALGGEGWELVAVHAGKYVFKRPAENATERFTREQTENALKGRAAAMPPPRLLNPQLAALARRIGHTQMLLVCDRGFPVPLGLPLGIIDLSVTSDVPSIPQVLEALLPELPYDRVIAAEEQARKSPGRWKWHRAQHTRVETLPHAQFKKLAGEALACIRTGDSTPYGNVIVVGG